MGQVASIKKKIDEVKGAYIDTYSRIVGYYRPVRNWNKGKQAEYSERATFEKSITEADAKAVGSPTESTGITKVLLFWKTTCPNCARLGVI